MKLLFCIVAIAGLKLYSAKAQTQKANAIIGTWINEPQNTGFEIYKEKDRYYAKIVWLAEPTVNGKPRLDKKNTDPEKRDNPLIGTEIMTAFVYEDGKWRGELYNPKMGKVFKASLSLLKEDHLAVTVYKNRWLSKTQYWSRLDRPRAGK